MKKRILTVALVAMMAMGLVACDYEDGSYNDIVNTKQVTKDLQNNQPTPTDIDYSLERYNLIRRAYWVNG